MLHTGIAWEHLPQELGFGLRHDLLAPPGRMDRGGVWPLLHEVLLAELRGANALDFSRAAVDGSHIRVLKEAPRRDEALSIGVGRAAKDHLITDATGIPLAATLTGGNRNDVTQLDPAAPGRTTSAGQARPAPAPRGPCVYASVPPVGVHRRQPSARWLVLRVISDVGYRAQAVDAGGGCRRR